MKKYLKRISSLICVVAMIVMIMPIQSNATEIGSSMSNAVEIEMNKDYTKTWYGSAYGEPHFSKFTVEKRGIIEIGASKPFDKDGIGSVDFKIYNEKKALIWGNGTYSAKNDKNLSYYLTLGLAPGTYYLAIEPKYSGYGVVSSISYSVNYIDDQFFEIEKNDSIDVATEMDEQSSFGGTIGSDGFYSAEDADYWKFYVREGAPYRVCLNAWNASFLNESTVQVDVIDSRGGEVASKYDIVKNVDEWGDYYIDFVADYAGYYYVKIWNYQGKQERYDLTCAPLTIYTISDFAGLRDGGDNNWYLYEDEDYLYICSYYTGLYFDKTYGWWYVENGRVRFDYTGLVCDPLVGWWYVQNGQVRFDYTGLVPNEYGWWYVQNGTINFNYNGLAYDPYVGWWYVQNGAINFGYTGLVPNEYGWWYVENGAINFNYNGLAYDPYVGWWVVNNGAINFGYTGMIANEYGWWYAVNGALDFNATGWACNEYGWWLYYNGTIAWNYTGWWDGFYCVNGHLA